MKERLTMLLACLFLMVGGAIAQTKVNGTVVNQLDNEPVIGASIMIVGTNDGTVTDANGRFELTMPEGRKTYVLLTLAWNRWRSVPALICVLF